MHYQFDWSVLYTYRGLLLNGLLATVVLSLTAMVLSSMLGILGGLGRVYGPNWLRWVVAAYVELFRNIPPIVHFFLWYFVFGLDIVPSAIGALSAYHGAFITELVRSGINAVPPTQWEAARSAGMGGMQTAVHIVLPQALMRIVPLASSQFVGVLKDSSIAMAIGYAELTLQTQEIESTTFRGFEAATAVTILYVALALIVVLLMHLVEARIRLDLRQS